MPEAIGAGLLRDGTLSHLEAGELGRYVFVPGDPDRCERIASYFESPRRVGRHREFELWTGTLDGVKVSVCSTGIGCPSTAVAVEELADLGADTFVRVGTSGAVREGSRPGDVVVVTGAVRDDGTSRQYLPLEYPAVADLDVVAAFREGARSVGAGVLLGVSQSKDSFYGEVEPKRMPIAGELDRRWRAWQSGTVWCSEMEAATLFTVAATRGLRAGGVMLVYGQSEETEMTPDQMLGRTIEAAIAGMRQLISDDRRVQSWPR